MICIAEGVKVPFWQYQEFSNENKAFCNTVKEAREHLNLFTFW